MVLIYINKKINCAKIIILKLYLIFRDYNQTTGINKWKYCLKYSLNFKEDIMNSLNLNSQTIAHIGVEFITIAGVAFWLNKKNNSLREEVDMLRNKLNQYEKILVEHDKILRSIVDGGPQSQPILTNKSQPSKQQHASSSNETPHTLMQTPNVHSSQPQHHIQTHPQHQPQSNVSDSDEESIIPDEELDDMLQDEIADITKNRGNKKTNVPPQIEIEYMDTHKQGQHLKKYKRHNKRQRVKKKHLD